MHCTDIKKILVNSSPKATKEKKNGYGHPKIPVSDPGPSWSSCYKTYTVCLSHQRLEPFWFSIKSDNQYWKNSHFKLKICICCLHDIVYNFVRIFVKLAQFVNLLSLKKNQTISKGKVAISIWKICISCVRNTVYMVKFSWNLHSFSISSTAWTILIFQKIESSEKSSHFKVKTCIFVYVIKSAFVVRFSWNLHSLSISSTALTLLILYKIWLSVREK